MIPYCSICWDATRSSCWISGNCPREEIYLDITDYHEVIEAIRTLAIRGAPAIGVAAAMGAALGALEIQTDDGQRVSKAVPGDLPGDRRRPAHRGESLLGPGPGPAPGPGPCRRAGAGPQGLPGGRGPGHAEGRRDHQPADGPGRPGRDPEGMRVLTHCNTGALATGAYGTALGVLRAAWEAGKRFSVWVDETRPLLQGARLTTWELGKLGIPYTLIPDGAAATLMHQGRVDLVILGADRIAANGDTANKIGTYSVAVLAYHHGIPFYVAAPLSTVDFAIPDGTHIPVEERAGEEVTHLRGEPVAPPGAPALNLAFDVTPSDMISGIITEKGVLKPPYTSSLKPFRPHQE